MELNTVLPAEWSEQSGVLLTWPHPNTDWKDILEEVEDCFIRIAAEISQREQLLIACANKREVASRLRKCNLQNIQLAEIPTNDTWARDHGPITVLSAGKPTLLDFCFNGWGMKFASNSDNQITSRLFSQGFFSKGTSLVNKHFFVLEGGSIESDGEGTLLTTRDCLCSINRNDYLSQEEIESYLISTFNLKRVLWLTSGFLAGDDTDSHIDTLARFCDSKTIAYVKCDDPDDEHYEALKRMEEELKSFRSYDHSSYNLIPLPMADPCFDGMQRLPATYANFLIINGAVLVPFYNSPKDSAARLQLQYAFPGREIIGINCCPLIKQHGSLHCVTMQLPKGVLD